MERGEAVTGVVARLDRVTQYVAASRFDLKRLWNAGSPAFAGDDSLNHTRTGPSVSKCLRFCSHASSTRLGIATSTQITKNSGHPVAFAT